MLKKTIYFDHAATTPMCEEAFMKMKPYFTDIFGNPNSQHAYGREAVKAVDEARDTIAAIINCKPNELYFTSGGTESDNWALRGAASAFKNKGRHIITSRIEHHAILHTCEYLEKLGFEITYLDVDGDGFVSPEALEKAIRKDTILVSIMMVNNEIGTIEPIKELAAVAKAHGVLFHTDAVQGLGNVSIDVKDLGVDFLSMSAHKIYGPKGVGALYMRKGVRITNFMHGGAQETKRRAGTENLAGIAGFGKAAELAAANLEQHIEHSTKLRNYFWEQIEANISGVTLNGSREKRHPGNLNVSFDYIEGESILLMLDAFGISISTGSACSSKSLVPSHVLEAIGISITKMNGTVRFTVGDFTTKEDIDYVVETLVKVVARLRELSPVTGQEGW